jgi:hypothetical protein
MFFEPLITKTNVSVTAVILIKYLSRNTKSDNIVKRTVVRFDFAFSNNNL